MKIIASSLLILAVVGLYLTHSEDSARLAEVKAGDSILVCHIGDDYVEIDPALVTEYSDGRWTFTNGYATQCFTYPTESTL